MTTDNKTVQRQILAHLHKFRARPLEDGKGDVEVGDPMVFALDKVVWLNFYHPRDLISGRLDLYNLGSPPPQHLKGTSGKDLEDGNIRIAGEFRGLGVAHSCYWGAEPGKNSGKTQKKTRRGTNQMYQNIIAEFFP